LEIVSINRKPSEGWLMYVEGKRSLGDEGDCEKSIPYNVAKKKSGGIWDVGYEMWVPINLQPFDFTLRQALRQAQDVLRMHSRQVSNLQSLISNPFLAPLLLCYLALFRWWIALFNNLTVYGHRRRRACDKVDAWDDQQRPADEPTGHGDTGQPEGTRYAENPGETGE